MSEDVPTLENTVSRLYVVKVSIRRYAVKVQYRVYNLKLSR